MLTPSTEQEHTKMAKSAYDFESQVQGIPCKVKVTYATKYIPESWNGPAEGGEFEFELLDRKGYRAKWLEAKVTEADVDRLEQKYEDYLKAQLGDY
jgi:hypothetical protein